MVSAIPPPPPLFPGKVGISPNYTPVQVYSMREVERDLKHPLSSGGGPCEIAKFEVLSLGSEGGPR